MYQNLCPVDIMWLLLFFCQIETFWAPKVKSPYLAWWTAELLRSLLNIPQINPSYILSVMFVHIGNGENILMLSKEMKNIYYRMYTIQSPICYPNFLLPSRTHITKYFHLIHYLVYHHTSTKYLFVLVRILRLYLNTWTLRSCINYTLLKSRVNHLPSWNVANYPSSNVIEVKRVNRLT